MSPLSKGDRTRLARIERELRELEPDEGGPLTEIAGAIRVILEGESAEDPRLPTQRRSIVKLPARAAPAELSLRLVTAVLEELIGAAFILGPDDALVAANAFGHSLLEGDAATRRALGAARRGRGDGRYTVTELTSRGASQHALLIARPAALLTPDVLRIAASRFGLTRRETEVAELLAQGRTNRSIAAALGCSERTVETHVSRILERADAPSRTAFVATLWSLVR